MPWKHFEKMGRWTSKGSFAVADQTLFVGANFAVNVVLARWLVPAQYGVFAFGFSIFLLISALHIALFTEPMLTFGAKKFRGELDSYLGTLLLLHLGISAILASGFFIASIIIGNLVSPMIGRALLMMAFMAPVMLFLAILRRALYIRFKPGISVIGGLIYFILQLALLYFFKKEGILTPATAFFLMGISSLVAGIFYIIFLHPDIFYKKDFTKSLVKEHLKYSRWSVATALTTWISSNIYYILLPTKFGLVEVGSLKAFATIIAPAVQVNGVLSMLIVPYLAYWGKEKADRFKSSARLALILLFAMNFAYFLILTIFPKQVLHLFYGGKYQEAFYFLPVYAVVVVLSGVSCIFGSSARALERPDLNFWASAASCVAAAGFGFVFSWKYGFGGAIIGLVISATVSLAVNIVMNYRNYSTQTAGLRAQ